MQYDVVFEGGGAKGVVFAGALEAFEARDHTYGRLLGTSAGAVAGALVAAGYTVEEFRSALAEKLPDGRPVFSAFLGQPRPPSRHELESSLTKATLERVDLTVLPDFLERPLDRLILNALGKGAFSHIFSFLERGGWYSADTFVAWLQRKLDAPRPDGRPRGFAGMTLLDFYLATGKDLSIVAADISDQRLLVLNHVTAPMCPVVSAVRMSMGIPLLWQEVVWERSWGDYLDLDLTGHRVVDGGLLSNFPIELFVSRDPYVVSRMGPTTSDGVLGLLIDERLPVAGATANPVEERKREMAQLPLPGRMAGLVDTALHAHDKMVMEAFEDSVCRLPAAGYGTVEFDMSDQRREALLAAGRAAAERYFDRSMPRPKGPADLDALERALAEADCRARAVFGP